MVGRISSIEVFGERNSGTNYLKRLLDTNLVGVDLSHRDKVGWKHADCTGVGKDWLIIVIYRNPITWLQAMHRAPHHAPQLRELSFSEFLEADWKCYLIPDFAKTKEQMQAYMSKKHLIECYQNIIHLRRKKIKLVETFKNRFQNVCYINYEALTNTPLKMIEIITELYQLKKKAKFQNYLNYKESRKIYKKRKYQRIIFQDFKKMINVIDWKTEKQIGYRLRSTLSINILFQTIASKLTKDSHPLLKYDFCIRGVRDGKKFEEIGIT